MLPVDMYDTVLVYLPQRVLLNHAYRKQHLAPVLSCPCLTSLGMAMRRKQRMLREYRHRYRETASSYHANLECDDPDPTMTLDDTHHRLVGFSKEIIRLRHEINDLNMLYTYWRARYLPRPHGTRR